MKISEAFDLYHSNRLLYLGQAEKTWKNHLCSLRSLIRSTGDVEISDLKMIHVIQWKANMDAKNMAVSTIFRYLCSLRKILEFMETSGYPVMKYQEILLPKVTKTQPKYLVSEEIRRMINLCPSLRDKALLALLFSTGCRISELLNLNIKDLSETFIIVKGKLGKERSVFIDEPTSYLTKAYLKFERMDELPYLFVGNQSKRLTVCAAQDIVKNASVRFGKRISPHALRHSFATDLAKKGMHIRGIQELLGHENVNTTQMYTHFAPHELREGYFKYHTVL
jgi:site-specific recombinase XerD